MRLASPPPFSQVTAIERAGFAAIGQAGFEAAARLA
jgi:hypothetical protein